MPASAPDPSSGSLLALDLGTTTGWAVFMPGGAKVFGTETFRPSRFEGGGMRFLRFRQWLDACVSRVQPLQAIYFEEVRRHLGVDAAHAYGGFLAVLTAFAEDRRIPYLGVPVGTIKRHATGKGNATKEQMVAAAVARGYAPANDNEADALALLDWAVRQSGVLNAANEDHKPLCHVPRDFSIENHRNQ